MVKLPRIVLFLHTPYRCKIEQPAIWKYNGIKNSERNVNVEVVF